MLIKLNSETHVAADQVSEIETLDNGVRVRLKDSRAIFVYPDYGRSPYQTKDRLVKLVNEAMK